MYVGPDYIIKSYSVIKDKVATSISPQPVSWRDWFLMWVLAHLCP